MNPLLAGTNYRFDADSGRIVSAVHQRIAEVIHDYNPELSLMWIPPDQRTTEDSLPFAVVHTRENGIQYPLFYLKEDEVDERVLTRIFYMDMSKSSPANMLTMLNAQEAAQKIMEAKEREERIGEQREFAKTLLKSPLHTFKHKGKKYS